MFKEFCRVKLKNGDDSVGINADDVGTIVDIANAPDGKKGYTIEFLKDGIHTNMDALLKFYSEEELIKVD